jgi:hypothetical protein
VILSFMEVTMKVDVSPKLYEAATESLVSDASAVSTFEKMITVGHSHATVETFAAELHATEKQIRKEFEVSHMPGPWRSAKSVIVSAMKMGIPLKDDNGVFCGKTFLQNKIRDMKAPKPEVTKEMYVDKICKLLRDIPEGLDRKSIHSEVHTYLMAL